MSEVDDNLNAAWREASREEPPPALDDALRAAARRAVGGGASHARHTYSWPLAAAAIVAVIAIGIVHMAPPEQVTPTVVAGSTLRKTAVKERDSLPPFATPESMNAAPRVAEQAAARVPADRITRVPPKQLEQPANVPSPNSTVALADKFQSAPLPGAGSPSSRRVAQTPYRELGESESKLETTAQVDDAKKTHAEPFPAAPAGSGNAADVAAPTSPPPVAAAKTYVTPRADALYTATSRRDDAVAPSAAPAAPVGSLATVAPDHERAKDSIPRTPDEWIKLIRRLQVEGRKNDVSRELAAFRTEYKDRADALLPPDLRDTK
jgi:hypothetical protein